MILPILTTPSKKLRQKAEEVKKIDQSVKKLALDMWQTLRVNFGIGLSAPQIGELKRIIVVEMENPEIPQTTILINPIITKLSKEKENFEESCLSLPGLAGAVSRSKEVKVEGLNLQGKNIKLSASGLFARVLQHEIDHLDGILFTDKADLKTLKKVPLPYKIVFLGTPEFAATILEELVRKDWGISVVVTEKDKPVGRRQILTPPPVKKVAIKYNLVVKQPEKILNLKSQILNLKPNLLVTAAYGQILPKEILEIPKYGSLCIHPSLLPKYRGPSPIQFAILNGEKETGVTIFKMDEKIDHGAILANLKLKIENLKLNSQELSKKLSNLASSLLLETLPLYLDGKIKPKPQNHKKATYTKMIKKEDGFVEKSKIQNPKKN